MRLGDYIDDHCSRCKRSTDHAIVAMAGEEVVQTRCRTCNSDHKYRHNKSRNKEMTAKEAFDQVLASVTGSQPETPKPKSKSKSPSRRHGAAEPRPKTIPLMNTDRSTD